MNTTLMIRYQKECFPEYKGQLYMNLTDTAKLFGLDVKNMREFICRRGIPYYRPNKAKMYNVLEVFDEIQLTRNAPERRTP